MEPSSHPVWKKRARCLATLVTSPMPCSVIEALAKSAWGWESHVTSQTLAAGEKTMFASRETSNGWVWTRTTNLGLHAEDAIELKRIRKPKHRGLPERRRVA